MICSLNPFYLDKNVVTSLWIEGNWSAQQIKNEKGKKNNSIVWEKTDTTGIWNIRQFIAKEKIKTKRGTDSTVFKPQNYYKVKLIGNTPDTVIYQFRLTLFRIKGVLYGDFYPIGSIFSPASRMVKENYVPVHTLSRIQVKNKQLFVSWLSTDCMQEMIEKKRVRVKYRYVPDAGRLLLTATPESLTGMIELYADQKRFIDWENQPAMLKLSRTNQLP
jgi:hypothetical protein